MTKFEGTLADILPPQDTYYILRHPHHSEPARMGGDVKNTGLLVFTLLEKAEIYCLQIAQHSEKGWQPSSRLPSRWERFARLTEAQSN